MHHHGLSLPIITLVLLPLPILFPIPPLSTTPVPHRRPPPLEEHQQTLPSPLSQPPRP
ncbi:hypothetical protein J3R83DRAFT_974 [Lanmaoa asiatica]|nr:hypothetical protein J3R83DRAFT_974 [Lanmaoa asiatica]